MKNNIFIVMGVVLYVVYSIVDRFFYRFPNVVAVPIMLIGLIIIFIGYMKS